MLSLIQPAHPQPLLNPFILLKHLHSNHKHIILLFPRIVIPPQSHTKHFSTQDGYQRMTQRAQLRMTIFFMGSDAQCTTATEQHDVGDESNSSFLGQTNLYSIISCNIQGLNTKKQKHKIQSISEFANNENTLTITLTETKKMLDSEIQMKN